MTRNYNPYQVPLFPDLFEDLYLPPITAEPDFNRAMENFIKIADFGALIDLNFHGLEKSYSLRMSELQIPAQMLAKDALAESPVFYLFPGDLHRRIQRFRYEVKSFFNAQNSIRTPDGYFLFRTHFQHWDNFRTQFHQNLVNYLQNNVGAQRYQEYFNACFQAGLDWLIAQLRPTTPYCLKYENPAAIEQRRKTLHKAGNTLAQLPADDPDYLLNCLIVKTMHIPLSLNRFLKGVSVTSTFKTIHLNYLKDVTIENLRDIKHLLEAITRKSV
jgi:hypothetical protein